MTDLTRLSPASSVWIFGIAPAIADPAPLLRRVDEFLAEWSAHGTPVLSGRELREGRFLVIAAEKDSETSGCSIDKLFSLVRSLERELGVTMLDPAQVYYRDGDGAVRDANRREFGGLADEETPVFDTTVQSLGEVLDGSWERPARDSWHAALLRRSA